VQLRGWCQVGSGLACRGKSKLDGGANTERELTIRRSRGYNAARVIGTGTAVFALRDGIDVAGGRYNIHCDLWDEWGALCLCGSRVVAEALAPLSD